MAIVTLARRARLPVVLLVLVVVAWLASASDALWERGLVSTDPPRIVSPTDAPSRPVAVVLGAKPGQLLSYRMDAACALVTLGKVDRLLLTGTDEEMPFMQSRARVCLPDDRILVDANAERTLDNLKNARDQFGVTHGLVVTQRFHLARALYLADALGMDLVGVEAAGAARFTNAMRERVARMRARFDVWRM